MKTFRFGIAKKNEVLEELAKNGYRLLEYDPRLCINCYTYIVNRLPDGGLVKRTYFFDSDNILINIKTV